MNRLAHQLLAVCPVAVAALLLLARNVLRHLALPAPTVAQILAATGASRSAAYEQSRKLAAVLPTLVTPRGRPKKPAIVTPAGDETAQVTSAAYAFLLGNPGCARAGLRAQYSDLFRHFVVELRATHAAIDVGAFANAVHVPLGTLKDWLRTPQQAPPEEESPQPVCADDESDAHVKTVLLAYQGWRGTFIDFLKHVRRELRVPFGNEHIRRILRVHGQRPANKRGRNTRDELALRGAFRTFFPGAQWVGDGMQLSVVIDGERFVFNLELHVDTHTDAFVGASVRDEEDSLAVTEAIDDGVATTGALPLAVLLDNKPSNHTPHVDAVLGDALRIRATVKRPQNKAHVEGAFGLFSQVLPHIALDTRQSPHDIAHALLCLVFTVWARTTNHRPRKSHGKKSRVELYDEVVLDEQVKSAKEELREIAERQERARRTLQARRRPQVLAFLDEHFDRLELIDPERHVRLAIAAYPLDDIVNGTAIFAGKRDAATLPEGADARYLFGIVKNVTAKREGEHIARAMLQMRLEARDRTLASLVGVRDVLRAGCDTSRVLAGFADRALATQSSLERIFWLDAVADTLLELPEHERKARFVAVARRSNATFAVTPRERQDAVRVVAERAFPVH